MKRKQLGFTGPVRAILGALALVVLFAFGTPQAASACTSGQHHHQQLTVTIDFQTPGLPRKPSAVTVATLAATTAFTCHYREPPQQAAT